jgi:hypothetical protein
MEQIKCYCGHTTYCDCGPLPKKQIIMKKSTLFKTLILVGAIALNIVFIVYLPHYILGLLGCWQLGAWMGDLAGKLASRIK